MVNAKTTQSLVLFASFALGACRPNIEGRPSLVQSERILAVRSVPADAKPKAALQYDSLFVGPDGVLDGEALDWALCRKRKALTETGAIASECLALEASVLEPLGVGTGIAGSVLTDGCELFGPTPAAPKAGEPSSRPADPDTTGGYYQSVRVVSGSGPRDYSVGVTRLACGLGGATQEQAADFTRRYRSNENPTLSELVLGYADGSEEMLSTAESDSVISVARGEQVTLRAAWADCSGPVVCGDGVCGEGEDSSSQSCPDDCKEPHGCTGSEPYVYFDPLKRRLSDRRESIRVSWFATAGRFEHERTGRTETEAAETTTTNPWTAPEESADVWLWVVIRDDRGGVGWSSYRLRVE
jgi:hypothetical protein